MHCYQRYIALSALIFLAACSAEKPPSPLMKIGKPYQIDGETYYPEYDSSYDKTGMGSWYGPGFHGKKTANGERFNEQDLTAAHPTLPMPSLVRVTNLKNGKSAIVRINDRGPFKKKRIIDLSRGSAERIGLHSTMKVRVKYLPKETEEYVKNWERTGEPGDMFAYNDRRDSRETQLADASTREPEEAPSSFSLISEARAEGAPVGSITSTDLPSPTKSRIAPALKAAPEADEIKPLLQSNPRTIYERETDNVPFGRGPSVPAPEEPTSNPPFKAVEPVKTAVSTGEEYYIQAGTFSHKDNAQHLTEKLAVLSGATMDKLERGGKEMWRVRVGPFVSRAAATEALETVHEYVPDAHISH